VAFSEVMLLPAAHQAYPKMKKLLLTALLLVCLPFAYAQTPPPMHIALLFDDGPTPEHMETYLALFKAESVHVTFSFVGKSVEAHPTLARAAVAAGHEVASHSYEHLSPGGLGKAALEHEVVGALKVFADKADIHPAWYWPPYIAITPELEETVAQAGLKIFRPVHLVGSDDYKPEVSGEDIRNRSLAGVQDGSVILFHEWRKESLEQMPAIIAGLKRDGAVFMTISGLTNYLGSTKNTGRDHPGI
jgi:peptidoglycan/xylan/chitin deacetylase (PgdA/CDA1 family)